MKIFIFSCFLLFLTAPAFSKTLSEIYEIALEEDPQLKIAEATFRANKEIKEQTLAGLLPSITTSASTTWNNSFIDNSKTDEYNSFGYSLRLSQPIIRVDRWFQFASGKALTESAAAQFLLSQQQMIFRVAQAYFGLLKAQNNLETAVSEERALKKQLDRAKRLFEENISPITDFQETQAFYDLSRVSRIASEGQLEVAREILIALVNEAPEISDLLDYPFGKVLVDDQDEWVRIGLVNSNVLKTTKLSERAAQNNAKASIGGHIPNIDLVGTLNSSTSYQGRFGGFIENPLLGLETESNNYSIQFSWPLVAGGIAHSKRREAYANYDKAKEQTKFTTRSVIQDIKSKHSSLLTARANVQAREQAFKSAESALIATEYGFEANTRNIIDLLNAQRNVFAAERDYASAKYDFILSDFALKLSAGTLSPQDLYNLDEFMN